jgi:hypothetical protein
MSRIVIQRPIYGIRCDRAGCGAKFIPDGQFNQSIYDGTGARIEAEAAGWQVRPSRGPGSRSALDLCPAHRDDAQAGGVA